jgi:hypothetical protein
MRSHASVVMSCTCCRFRFHVRRQDLAASARRLAERTADQKERRLYDRIAVRYEPYSNRRYTYGGTPPDDLLHAGVPAGDSHDPPENPASRGVGWREALIWSISLGVGAALSRLVAQRGAAAAWQGVTGSQPGLNDRSERHNPSPGFDPPSDIHGRWLSSMKWTATRRSWEQGSVRT